MKPTSYSSIPGSGSIGFDPSATTGHLNKIILDVKAMPRDDFRKAGMSAFVGMLLGLAISLIINSTLVEISVSPFFALYFGILFMSVGGIIIYRLNGAALFPSNDVANEADQALLLAPEDEVRRKKQLTFFACLILFSGFLCFILEKNWFVGLSWVSKIPLYTILGISVAFALVFSVVDLVNYMMGFLRASVARPVVESSHQVYLIMSIALIMGATFGFIFGVMDIEDEIQYQVRLALLKEERTCLPIGGLLGAIAGFGNEYLRLKSDEYVALQSSGFDDDI
jgi:MFS family permease